jgi:ppGpp synthetase/RelA/SpoT-type nucleotidyltranferase
MDNAIGKSFPGGSRSKVNLAGNNIRSRSYSPEDLRVVEEWRAAHRAVLNTFQAILRNRTRTKNVVVAQRHKRRSTIFGKLDRYPEMQLSRMDDVAGCRLIFLDIERLYSFRDNFHKAQFHHKRRNELDKYDYIKKPKSTGYRGIHDVYVYDVNSIIGRHLKGLMVEVQYRTKIQHAWATAVEVIGFITESQPKFQEGDTRYQNAMAFASEIIARVYEKSTGPFPEKDNHELVRDFLMLDQDLKLLSTLRNLNAADQIVSSNRNTILIFSESGELEVKTYRDAPEALRALFQLEKDRPEKDIVLVRADTSEDVRFAFKNYFSDAQDFIDLVENGCQILSGTKVIDEKVLLNALKGKAEQIAEADL